MSGDRLGLSDIVWDAGAGAGAERIIPGAFLGAFMFSVPPDAAPGVHQVAVQNLKGRSAALGFTVTPAVYTLGPPRIDAVTILGAEFDGSGNVTTTLYVQGANIDVGAVVAVKPPEVTGGTGGGAGAVPVDVPTVAHKALRHEMPVPPGTQGLGYPILHYLSLVAVVDARPIDSTLEIVVRNLDGSTSGGWKYTLPHDQASLDSDGDGLPDSWETSGYDADGNGTVDVDLHALGADPYRRDLFVQVDVMDGLLHAPAADVFSAAQTMFRMAPIINPMTDNGINLVLDVTTGKVPHFKDVNFDDRRQCDDDGVDSAELGTAKFSTIKSGRFDTKVRGKIYHYAIWADQSGPDKSGCSDWADDFIVAFDWANPAYFDRPRSRIEALAHELGHDLRQHHGGDDDRYFKATYWSVMSYSWDLRSGNPNDTFRAARATCAPLYYADPAASEPGGARPPASSINSIVGYSEGMGATLVQGTSPTLVCGETVQWAMDGSGPIGDFANWRALWFGGPADDGAIP